MGLNSQDVASNKEEEEPSGSYCEDGLLFKVLLHAVLLLFFAELVLPPLKKKIVKIYFSMVGNYIARSFILSLAPTIVGS